MVICPIITTSRGGQGDGSPREIGGRGDTGGRHEWKGREVGILKEQEAEEIGELVTQKSFFLPHKEQAGHEMIITAL